MTPTDSAEKFQNIFIRRASKGQCFHHPYFGAREFPAEFQLWEDDSDPVGFEQGHRDLGYMLCAHCWSDSGIVRSSLP